MASTHLRIYAHSSRACLDSTPMKNALVRTVVVAIALVVGAWLAVGYRESQLEEKGSAALAAIQHAPLPPKEAREGLDALRDAQWLNPDQDPRVIEGELNLFLSKRAKSQAIGREITAREPENVRGWFLSYLAERDPAKRHLALRHVQRLDPWAADALH